MQKDRTSPGRRRTITIIVLILMYPLYLGVMAVVREYVSTKIQASVGKQVYSFELKDRSGTVVRAVDLRGKIVVLNFFRSKCVGCQAEKPVIDELNSRLIPAKAVLLSVMMDEVQSFSKADTEATLREFAYQHPVLMADRAFVDAFHGAGWAGVTPVTYVVGPEGEILHALRGHRPIADFLNVLPTGSYH